MQPLRTIAAVTLVLALAVIIACLVAFAIGAAFYALTVLSGEAFVGFVLSTGLAIAAMALLNRFALPLLKRNWQ